jgi:hypothetical protein
MVSITPGIVCWEKSIFVCKKVSTMTSLVFMPAWIYTLGKTLMIEARIIIPFLDLVLRLLFTVVPCLAGVLISIFVPKMKKFVAAIAKPFANFIVFTFLALTIYTKAYAFGLVGITQWLYAPFIPFCGFLIGGLVAFLAKFPLNRVLTIAIETGEAFVR